MLQAQSTIGLQMFLAHNQEQNAQVSPLRYSGSGFGMGLAYERAGVNWRAGIEVLHSSAPLRSRISRHQEHFGETQRLTVNLPFQRRVFAPSSRLSGFTLGAQLSGDLLYRQQNYSPMLSTEHYVDTFLWLGLSAGWRGALGAGWQVQELATLPVVGVAWRTPYTGAKYAPSAEFTSPGTLLGPHNRIALTHRLSNRFDLRASYELQLLRHESTWNLATTSNRFGLGLDWRLHRSADPPQVGSTTRGAP